MKPSPQQSILHGRFARPLGTEQESIAHFRLALIVLRLKRTLDSCTDPYGISAKHDTDYSGKDVCSACGQVCGRAAHDGVAFENLPEDWKCPRCKQGQEPFNRA